MLPKTYRSNILLEAHQLHSSPFRQLLKLRSLYILIFSIYAPDSRKGGWCLVDRGCSIKKTWESNRYSSHELRLWHCPSSRNEQRRDPRRYVLKHISTEFLSAHCGHKNSVKRMRIYTSRRHLPLHLSLRRFETARFQSVKHKAQ